MVEVTIEQLYSEAVTALGESVVQARVLAKEIERLTAAAVPPAADAD